ncbi:E3 ubiquitin-protein ligase RAD18-like [Cloeon dipterum]|uniref:E3 ubiquitin-protein ligase RAD18-like n=1 Tax=Cloeon dipterum TaxID=197152 RepID=UPI00321FA947
MEDNAGEEIWAGNPPALETMEYLLRCGICYETMNIALITPCSHNFCSLCIRKYMQYKTSCPRCFANVNESELKNNRVLDEIITLLPRLKTQVKISPTDGIYLETPSEENRQVRTPQKQVVASEPAANLAKESLNTSFGSAPGTPKGKAKPTPEGKAKPRSIWESLTRSPVAGSSKVVPKVPCPVCGVQIAERSINLHIDKCLDSGGKPQGTNSAFMLAMQKSVNLQMRKRMPKLVYSLMKDAELRKRCYEVNLSIQGDRKTLIKRHKRYTLMYNSECDSANPRPVEEIVNQVMKEEREERMANSNPWKSFQVDRKADPKVIEQAQAKYRSENQSHFSKLMADLKQRQSNKKDAKQKSATQTSAEKSPSLKQEIPRTPSPEKPTDPSPGNVSVQAQEVDPGEQQEPASGEPGTPNSEMDLLLTQQHSPELRKKRSTSRVSSYLEDEDSDSPFSEPRKRVVSPVYVVSDDDPWDDEPRQKVTKRLKSSQDEQPLRRSRRKKLKS